MNINQSSFADCVAKTFSPWSLARGFNETDTWEIPKHIVIVFSKREATIVWSYEPYDDIVDLLIGRVSPQKPSSEFGVDVSRMRSVGRDLLNHKPEIYRQSIMKPRKERMSFWVTELFNYLSEHWEMYEYC